VKVQHVKKDKYIKICIFIYIKNMHSGTCIINYATVSCMHMHECAHSFITLPGN